VQRALQRAIKLAIVHHEQCRQMEDLVAHASAAIISSIDPASRCTEEESVYLTRCACGKALCW
jgi:hypothetical protein